MKEAAVPGIAEKKTLLKVRLRKHEKTANVPLLPPLPPLLRLVL